MNGYIKKIGRWMSGRGVNAQYQGAVQRALRFFSFAEFLGYQMQTREEVLFRSVAEFMVGDPRTAVAYLQKREKEHPAFAPQRQRMEWVIKRQANPEKIEESRALKALLEKMKQEVSKNPIYDASEYWSHFGSLTWFQLETYGMENFKRTVSHCYQNWLVCRLSDPQMKTLLSRWPDFFSSEPLLNTIEAPSDLGWHDHNHLPFYDLADEEKRRVYQWFVGLLWEFVRGTEGGEILDQLEESEIGNPIDLRRRGKRISSDLAHSVKERGQILKTTGIDPQKPFVVAELGAGFGRVAEVFLQTTACKYLIFDIPPALAVSQWYLQRRFPDKKIKTFDLFEKFDDIREEYEKADLVIFSANQIEKIPDGLVDLFININSLMEMRDGQIKNYLHHMSRISMKNIFLKQWIRWTNVYDNCITERSQYQLPSPWKEVHEQIDEVYPDFFIRVFVRL